MANKLTPPPPTGTVLDRWLALLYQLLTASGQILWTQISKAGSNLTDIETRNHNDLQTVQGGGTTERYHLTLAEHSEVLRDDNVTSVAVNTTLDDTHKTVLVTASGKTITLPAGSSARIGKVWTVIFGTNGYCNIMPSGSDVITLPNNQNAVRLNNKGASLSLRCLTAASWGVV